MYENGSTTTCSGFHRLHLRITPRVWGWAVGQHTLFACSPQPPSHTLSKYANSRVWEWAVPHAVKRKDSLTLLPQNHLDHFNNLLLDLWYRTIHDLLPDKCTSTRAVA